MGKSTSGKQVENHSHSPGTGEGDSTMIILRWKGDNTIIMVLSLLKLLPMVVKVKKIAVLYKTYMYQDH